jgi:YfiH family protein
MSVPEGWLVPDWPAPRGVRAFVTTRFGGVSTGEYGSMNLGKSGGDDPRLVEANRAIVRAQLPAAPRWMAQVHGTAVADLDTVGEVDLPRADAAVTGTPGRVAVVLTADCMPLFFCDEAGRRVGVAHAGWRGMSAGVIENTVRAMAPDPGKVMAWMGPAIGPDAFEVGPEVREAFLAVDPAGEGAFVSHRPGKYMADLYALARLRLARAGVERVFGGGFCTWRDSARFFSYRRKQESGRMGAFIWVE